MFILPAEFEKKPQLNFSKIHSWTVCIIPKWADVLIYLRSKCELSQEKLQPESSCLLNHDVFVSRETKLSSQYFIFWFQESISPVLPHLIPIWLKVQSVSLYFTHLALQLKMVKWRPQETCHIDRWKGWLHPAALYQVYLGCTFMSYVTIWTKLPYKKKEMTEPLTGWETLSAACWSTC